MGTPVVTLALEPPHMINRVTVDTAHNVLVVDWVTIETNLGTKDNQARVSILSILAS